MLVLLKGKGASAQHYRRLVTLDYTLTVELEGAATAQRLISGHAQAVTFVTGKAGHFAEGDSGTDWAAKLSTIKQTSKTSSVVQEVEAQFTPAFAQEVSVESVAQDGAVPLAQVSVEPLAQERKPARRLAQKKKPSGRLVQARKKKLNGTERRESHWADGMTVDSAWHTLTGVDFSSTYDIMTKEQKRACAYLFAADNETFRSVFIWPIPGALAVASCAVRARLPK